jgi:hypothetical protein
VSPDDSSRNVTEKRAEFNPANATAAEPPPATSDDAIKLAIKLAVDAGDYERASALIDVAKRTARTSASVTRLGSYGGEGLRKR